MNYKCDWYGRDLIQIDKFYPSSKTCNHCNSKNDDLVLSDREWICPTCKKSLDRDLNASYNIENVPVRRMKDWQEIYNVIKEKNHGNT